MSTVLVLGVSGYMGSAITAECRRRGIMYGYATRKDDHYDTPAGIEKLIAFAKPELVINAAAYIPAGGVDLCKEQPMETMAANFLLPKVWAGYCRQFEIPFMQLSTGCLFDEQREYTEEDEPTRSLDGYCGVYLKSKLLAETAVKEVCPKSYILRLRLPFDEYDHPRNYLTKLAGFPKVWDHVNSLTHRGDFAEAALDLWESKAAYGIYHVVNPGTISARALLAVMNWIGHVPEVIKGEACGCKLSTAKLSAAGVKMRHVSEAVADAVNNWKPRT